MKIAVTLTCVHISAAATLPASELAQLPPRPPTIIEPNPEGPGSGGWFPIAPEVFPNVSGVLSARKLAASNRATLNRVLNRLRGGDEAKICSKNWKFPPRREESIRWVHFPKCGSTFLNTVLNYGCDAFAQRRDISLGAPVPPDVAATLSRPVSSLSSHELVEWAKHACPPGSNRWSQDPDGNALGSWSTHRPVNPEVETGLVGLFRSPAQRSLSAFHFGKHLWGGEGHGSNGTISTAEFVRWRDWVKRSQKSARAFAATPGVGGCMAKMLSGCYCATRPKEVLELDTRTAFALSLSVACYRDWTDMDKAWALRAASVVSDFEFVGLQPAYNASVCLFHRIYGGDIDPAEFEIFNAGTHKGATGRYHPVKRHSLSPVGTPLDPWDEEALGRDFVDLYDEYVWATALKRFEADLDNVLRASQRQ